jgi:chromosomal replication initiation ATPase DnaA
MNSVLEDQIQHYNEVRKRLNSSEQIDTKELKNRIEELKKENADLQEQLKLVKDEWRRQQVWSATPCHFIIEEVAAAHGLTSEQIMGTRRHGALARARQEAYYRCVMETNYSYPKIARVFDRDHTTIMYGANKYAKDNDLPDPTKPKRAIDKNAVLLLMQKGLTGKDIAAALGVSANSVWRVAKEYKIGLNK